MIRRLIVSLTLLLMPVAAAMADSYEDARVLWLQGDDALSLPMLAELAHNRDTRARILLGRIEVMDRGPSPYRMALPRDEARALFRNVEIGGRFGRSWLQIEALSGNELAQRLLEAHLPVPNLELIARLTRLNEVQATGFPSRVVALYGSAEQHETLLASGMMLDDLLPFITTFSHTPEPNGLGMAALRHIAGPFAQSVHAGDADTQAMASLLTFGIGIGTSDVGADNPWRPVVENWLMQAPAAQPVADLCRTRCGDDAPACAFAILALSGGYYEMIRLDSPSETYIPQDEFLASPRARIMALRHAALKRSETNTRWIATPEQIAPFSTCAADLIDATRATYAMGASE